MHKKKSHYFLVFAMLVSGAFCVAETALIRLKNVCRELTPDIIYSDMMRNVLINDEDERDLFYFDETEVSVGVIGINKAVLKRIVCNNLFEKCAPEYKRKNAPPVFYYVIDKSVYDMCLNVYEKIISDIRYFPVAADPLGKEDCTFEDTWGSDRNYGGNRHHEGTDIMAGNNIRNYFPIVSVSDGVIEQMGWLELGGYRIGIRSTSGAYYYYAHLAAYADNIAVGDYVSAGETIGTMGDTGYSKVEGTTGKFDVHLHFGIYINNEQKDEISYNPYGILHSVSRCRRSFIDNTK